MEQHKESRPDSSRRDFRFKSTHYIILFPIPSNKPMITFKKLLAGLLMAAAAVPGMAAQEVDSEGYPVMYVRGTFNNWDYGDDSRLTRSGDTYSITMSALDGDFKVSNSDWSINYGADATITESTTFNIEPDGANIKASGLTNVSISYRLVMNGDQVAPSQMTVTVDGGTPRPAVSGTLPVLYINVYTDASHTQFNNEIISKDLDHKNYFSDAEYWLDLNGCEWMAAEGAKSIGSPEEPLPLEIKARGNWTRRGFAKKPFKLKLGAKQKLLGLSKSKHFAILAHADDNCGYLRNFVGFNLGKRIGLPWTPAQQPVEVVINGDYRGLYFLTESIRIEGDRVDIEELDDNVSDPVLCSGGYLVELDNYDEDNQIRMEEKSCVDTYCDVLRITADTPEEYSELQRRFITDQFTAMNDAVGSCSDALWSYMDLDDAVRYYIVEEMISHVEAYHGSTYLFRDRGENQKWHFSPLWDCGNAFNGPADGFFYDHDPYGNTWIPSIRQNHKFNDKLQLTWLWFMNTRYEGLIDDIDAYVAHIATAARYDRSRWQNAPVPDGGMGVVDNSDMQARRNKVVDHLNAKLDWLRGKFGDYEHIHITDEPARDDTAAAPLPDYLSSGVEDVVVDPADAPAEYYTLQGIRVAAPAPGNIYIVRQGTTVRKVAF